ncbi:hypothetical protein D3C75_1056520 [compost metagenome]
MEYAGIDVAEHSVLQIMRVQQLAKFCDEIRQVFWWYSSVLNKGLRTNFAFHVTKQTNGALSHRVNARNSLCAFG